MASRQGNPDDVLDAHRRPVVDRYGAFLRTLDAPQPDGLPVHWWTPQVPCRSTMVPPIENEGGHGGISASGGLQIPLLNFVMKSFSPPSTDTMPRTWIVR